MVSIIIPVYNNLSMTADCLTSVINSTEKEYGYDYGIVIVDNGSNPPFPSGSMTDPTIIRNDTNLGYPVAVNQGIRAAKGEVVILLNNDCIVPPGWLERIVGWLDSYDIVGTVTNYCAGLQQVKIPIYHDYDEFNEQAMKWGNQYLGESQEVNWVIGFCMAFKKSLWESIGIFDESMWPSSGEEIEFCLRARAADYRIGIVKDVYLHHFGSVTFKDLDSQGVINYQDLCKKTSDHVMAKWGNFWQNQLVERN